MPINVLHDDKQKALTGCGTRAGRSTNPTPSAMPPVRKDWIEVDQAREEPCLPPGAEERLGEEIGTACQVVRKQGEWYVMSLRSASADRDHAQIGLARSKDGVTGWQRHPANPIIRPGKGRWDADAVYKPYVIFRREMLADEVQRVGARRADRCGDPRRRRPRVLTEAQPSDVTEHEAAKPSYPLTPTVGEGALCAAGKRFTGGSTRSPQSAPLARPARREGKELRGGLRH